MSDPYLIPEAWGEGIAEDATGFRRSPCCDAPLGVDTRADLLACTRCGTVVPSRESPLLTWLRRAT
jgi:hypothetical protein